jgi:hypothetical protein
MSRLLIISFLSLSVLTGCGRAPKASVPELSAYTNIPPGTPVAITIRVQPDVSAPKFMRDALKSVTYQGILVSITTDEVAIRQSPTDTQAIHFEKEAVSSIQTNTP